MPPTSPNIDPHLRLGNIKLSQGKFQEAIDAYNQAVQARDTWGTQHDTLFPYETSFHEVLLKRSVAHTQLQHHAQSKADLEEAIRYCTTWTAIIKLQSTIDQNHQQILAALFNTLGNAYARTGQPDRAIASHNESIRTVKSVITSTTLPKSVLTPLNNLLVDSLNNLGNIHHARGECDIEIACRTEGLALMQGRSTSQIDIASTLNNLGNAYLAKGDHTRAIECHDKSLAMMQRITTTPHHVTASIFNNLGSDHQAKGELDVAIEYYVQSLRVMKAIPHYPYQLIVLTTNNLGNAYHSKGEWNKEIACRMEDLERMQATYKGAPHIDIASALNNLGNAHQAKGEHDRAIECHTESLAMTRAMQSSDNPLTAISLNNLGNAYQAKGEWDEASKYYIESLQVQKTIHHAPLCLVLASSFSNLGNSYQARGEYEKAINCHSKHLETTKIIHGAEPNLLTAIALNNLGSAHFMKGAFAQAMEYQDLSLKMMQRVQSTPPHLINLVLTNLGNDYCALGRYDDAIALNPRSVPYHYAKYKFLSKEHRAGEATACLEQAVKLSGSADLIQHLVNGDRDYVVEKLEQLLMLAPPTQNVPCEQRDNPHPNLSFDDVKQATPTQISSDGDYIPDGTQSSVSVEGMSHARSDTLDDAVADDGVVVLQRQRHFFDAQDKYGNSLLSEALETKKYQDIKAAFSLQHLSNAELLRYFACKMNDREYKDSMQISQQVASGISVEVTDQLELLGESIADIVASYDF